MISATSATVKNVPLSSLVIFSIPFMQSALQASPPAEQTRTCLKQPTVISVTIATRVAKAHFTSPLKPQVVLETFC